MMARLTQSSPLPLAVERYEMLFVLLPQRLSRAHRLADVADRFLVMVLDPRIDDERRPDDFWRLAQFGRRYGKDDVYAGLHSLAFSGHHNRPILCLGRLVEFDVLQVLFEPLLKHVDSRLLVLGVFQDGDRRPGMPILAHRGNHAFIPLLFPFGWIG